MKANIDEHGWFTVGDGDLDRLGVSARALNTIDFALDFQHALRGENFSIKNLSIKNLAKLSRQELLLVNGCGKDTVNEIQLALKKHGLSLRGENSPAIQKAYLEKKQKKLVALIARSQAQLVEIDAELEKL